LAHRKVYGRLIAAILVVSEARSMLAAWRDDYNRVRPHSALANRTPGQFRDHRLAFAATSGSGQNFSPGLSLVEERMVPGQGKSTAEIIGLLHEAEVRLGQGESISKICLGSGISDQSSIGDSDGRYR
jgi:hypothetical protein